MVDRAEAILENLNRRQRQQMPGKPQVFMPYSGGVRGYRRILENTAASGYKGMTLRRIDQTATV
jgi:hypothetical protein